jgi:type IV pilus assembly protein PilQ
MRTDRENMLNRTLFAKSLRYTVVLLGVFASVTAYSQEAGRNLLESINTTAQQGGKIVIRANFKQPLTTLPAAFTVTNPARIALDLPNTSNGLGKSTVEVGEGAVRSISVVEVANRTRMVVNLSQTLNYTSALDGNALVLTVDSTLQGISKDSPQTAKFAEPSALAGTQRQSIRDVDFRRGTNGEGRVVVDLSSANTGIDIRQQGKSVIVDFLNTAVPRNLVRSLDVLDFATPVKTVDLVEQGGSARMVIEPKGSWEYSAYQTDTQFIVEIKPLKEDPNKLVQGTGYNGEKLTLNFQAVEVRALLQVIADFTGLNIVASDTVGGNLTLRLKDVPWDQALDIILQAKNLAKRKNGNVVLIAPADELATKDKLALEALQQIGELEPTRTESFVLAYAKAADIKLLLSDKDQKILSKRGSASVDVRTNTLFVQDAPTRLEEVRRLVSQLDVPVKQVMIESRIVIADDKFSRELGARFGLGAGLSSNGRNVGISSNLGTVSNSGGIGPVGSGGIARGALPDGALNVNLPVSGAAGSLGLTFLNLGNGNVVNLELSALEADNRGKIVSSPKVITADKRKATITQGTEIPYLTQAASGGLTIAFKAALLSLEVTPQITPDDKIIMDIEIKKDTVGVLVAVSNLGTVPSIDTKFLKTQIVVENGDTAVLGGVFEQLNRTDTTKVPFLGDLPFVGNLFKTTRKQEDKTELLVFITPRIIKDQLTIR